MFRKSVVLMSAVAVLGSSVYGADAYYAHFDRKSEELIKVDGSSVKINMNDEIIQITAERIIPYKGEVLSAKNNQWEAGVGSNDMTAGFQWCTTNPSKDMLEKGYIKNYETCESMFMTWNGQFFSTIGNTVLGWGVIANAAVVTIQTAFMIPTLGETYPFQNGLGYFAQFDQGKFDKVVEKHDLKSYQLKLKTGN